jgi:hypothetical protein
MGERCDASRRSTHDAAWSLAQLFDLTERDVAQNGFPVPGRRNFDDRLVGAGSRCKRCDCARVLLCSIVMLRVIRKERLQDECAPNHATAQYYSQPGLAYPSISRLNRINFHATESFKWRQFAMAYGSAQRIFFGKRCMTYEVVFASGVRTAIGTFGGSLKPMARLLSYGHAGVDPRTVGIGPVKATRIALERAGLQVSDLDVIESNEAFAEQACAVTAALGLDPAKVNPNGSGAQSTMPPKLCK